MVMFIKPSGNAFAGICDWANVKTELISQFLISSQHLMFSQIEQVEQSLTTN